MGVLRQPEKDLIKHALGLTHKPELYRNHFCARDGHSDMPTINSLVQLGFMRESHKINDGQDTIYIVTDAGRAALSKKI